MHGTLVRKPKESARKGTRAEKLVRQAFPALTAAQAAEAIALGWVRATGPLAKGTRLLDAQALEFGPLRAHLDALARGNPGLSVPILHTDSDFWAVDKPAGMPGHPLRLDENETVTHWALARDPELAGRFGGIQPTFTPHRLDTGTSGLLIVARTADSFAQWRARFTNKEVEKTYRAWCWGVPAAESWECRQAIGKGKGKAGTMAVDGREARPALSRVRVIRALSDRFLAEVVCETGVTHQVRVHLSHAGFPLLGDRKYDAAFNSRLETPEWHQLRAVRLRWANRELIAPPSAYV